MSLGCRNVNLYIYKRCSGTMGWLANIGLLLVVLQYTDGACPADGNGLSRFGPACEYLCHCNNGNACDQVTGECDASWCENGWMGPGCQYRDIAFNKPAGQIDTVSSNTALLAVDGELTTCSETEGRAGSRTKGPWWRVYYTNPEPIRGLVISTTTSGLAAFQQGFRVIVETIDDTQHAYNDYIPPYVHVCYEHTPGVDFTSSKFEVYCSEALVGNQVRIHLNNIDAKLELCEVNIFGGRNVALGKRVLGSSVVTPVELAVDGVTSTDDASKCFRTTQMKDPWFHLNLLQLFNVYTVKLIANDADSISNNRLWSRVTVDGQWTMVHDEHSESVSPATHISVVNELMIFRFKRYLTSASLSLCEVQVFGDCPENKCGLDCSMDCQCGGFTYKQKITGVCYLPAYCPENKCGLDCSIDCHCSSFTYQQKITGVCTSGCQGRWAGSGQNCDTECGEFAWGDACQNTCGHCHRNSSCDATSGSCAAGCETGYEAPTCIEEVSDSEGTSDDDDEDDDDSQSSLIFGFAGGVAGAALLIALALMIFYLRKSSRERQSSSKSHHRSAKDPDRDYQKKSHGLEKGTSNITYVAEHPRDTYQSPQYEKGAEYVDIDYTARNSGIYLPD